jgi:cyclopropane fatty-acyl-phospholipid synthase-like methyltransferase
MHACLSQGYNNVFGVDIDIKAIQECKNHNLQVEEVNPIIMENPFDVKFDIIILTHVLEHIEKEFVIEFLQRLRNNFLSQEGKLLIAVPNAQSNTNCYWAYEDWTHNTLFTAGSLRFVLMAAGFNVIEFIDIDCKLGTKGFRSRIRNVLLWLYKENRKFWNKITYSYYHQPSPIIYSYEIKASARI